MIIIYINHTALNDMLLANINCKFDKNSKFQNIDILKTSRYLFSLIPTAKSCPTRNRKGTMNYDF